MLKLEHDAVKSLPSGLCACRLNGESVHIFALSPHSVYLRTEKSCPADSALSLALYRPETGNYVLYTLNNVQIGPAQRHEGAVLTRFSFQDHACASAIRKTLNSYARYLEIKSSEGAAAYAAYAVGYPEEEDERFHTDIHLQRAAWFAHLAPLPELPDHTELAVELNCPELWNLYLQSSPRGFMQAYAACRNLPEGYLPNRKPNRLYIGNPYCRHLFPSEENFRLIAEKAKAEALELSIVSAELRSYSVEFADLQIALAKEWNAELVVNDWGMLQRASKALEPGQIVLGAVLNRRRKDPRMAYKAGLAGREELLARNNLNDPLWIAFLHKLGVERFEFESCALPLQTPPGQHSLHFPFYQTNMSLWCPIRALCLHGDRGAQMDASSCSHYCERNYLIYPQHLKLLGRWKALLALDEDLCVLNDSSQFDRWVLNF